MKRAKNAEIYEVLTLFLGFFGLNRLYLGQPGNALARLLCVASALVLSFTGFALLSTPLFVAAGGFYALLVALWIADYVRIDAQIGQAG